MYMNTGHTKMYCIMKNRGQHTREKGSTKKENPQSNENDFRVQASKNVRK